LLRHEDGSTLIELERKAVDLLKRIAGNRRRAVRIPVACRVAMFTTDREGRSCSFAATTEDLSIVGTRLRLPSMLEEGTRVGLELEIPEGLTEAIGRVVHAEAGDFGVCAGIDFTMIESQSKARIARYLAAEERRRRPNVSVEYDVTCTVPGTGAVITGSTEECSPGYVTLALREPVEPGAALRVRVASRRGGIELDGHVARCYRHQSSWVVGLQLARTQPAWAQRWIDHLVELRVDAR
jgi:hypothetical protein